jgi:hypothetical protein
MYPTYRKPLLILLHLAVGQLQIYERIWISKYLVLDSLIQAYLFKVIPEEL